MRVYTVHTHKRFSAPDKNSLNYDLTKYVKSCSLFQKATRIFSKTAFSDKRRQKANCFYFEGSKHSVKIEKFSYHLDFT